MKSITGNLWRIPFFLVTFFIGLTILLCMILAVIGVFSRPVNRLFHHIIDVEIVNMCAFLKQYANRNLKK